MVFGGLSMIKRGSNQIISLEADKYTVDPDLPANEPAVRQLQCLGCHADELPCN